MSSHHVIRENQEPAVAILHSSYDEKILNQALEWSPYIISISSCAEKLISQGIKLDAIITNESPELDLKQGHITFIKDRASDLRGVLSFLKENDHKAVHVFSKFKLEITPIVQEFDLTTNVIDEDLKWSYIRLGKVRKWFPKNTKIRIVGPSKVVITTQNGEQVSKEVFKTNASGIFTIESAQPFWLGEHIH